jgi:hypothetical protein
LHFLARPRTLGQIPEQDELDNWWYCEGRPEASTPKLPAPETGGVYGIDPELAAPARNDFRPLDAPAAAFGATAWTSQTHGKP